MFFSVSPQRWSFPARYLPPGSLTATLAHTLISFPSLAVRISVSSLMLESNLSPWFELTHFAGNLSTEDSLPILFYLALAEVKSPTVLATGSISQNTTTKCSAAEQPSVLRCLFEHMKVISHFQELGKHVRRGSYAGLH